MANIQSSTASGASPSDGKSVAFHFLDDVEKKVAIGPGELVLDKGLAAGLPLLYQCRSGTCTSCIARLVEGEASHRAGSHTSLLASEYADGMRLMCQTEVETDCRFELSYGSDAGAVIPAKAKALINKVERLSANVVRLEVELGEGQWAEFRPGQFFQITIPGTNGAVRSYSPASTPDELPRIEFLVRLIPGGLMSEWLVHHAERDMVLDLEGGFGSFFFRPKPRAPHVFVAGGTGIAPILSIIDSLRAQSGRKPPLLLSFGCTSPEALFGLEEIRLREQWMPTLQTRISVDRGATEGLLEGTPVDALHADDVRSEATVAYLCGPPPMIAAARARLEELGVASDNIYTEQFVPTSE